MPASDCSMYPEWSEALRSLILHETVLSLTAILLILASIPDRLMLL